MESRATPDLLEPALQLRGETGGGHPLVSHEVIVKLIGETTTSTGLAVKAQLDKRRYPLKIKVTEDEMKSLKLKPHKFHGEWNYSITP